MHRARSTRMLFPIALDAADVPTIPGLHLIDSYRTESEASRLVAAIDAEAWDPSWKRSRQLYGRTYGHNHSPVHCISDWATSLIERLHDARISDQPFDQMLVNEYLPDQGVAPHRDYAQFDRTGRIAEPGFLMRDGFSRPDERTL